MFTGNISGSIDCPSTVTLSVQPGQTVTVTNLAGPNIFYDQNLDGNPDGTLVATGSQAFTSPTNLIASGSATTIQIVGGGY